MQILEKLKKKTLYPIVKNPELGDSLSFFFIKLGQNWKST